MSVLPTTLPCLPELHVSLDSALPREAETGAGTALFIAGTCFSPRARLSALELIVDGAAQPVMAHGMPRLDFFEDVRDAGDDPLALSYRSGFWAIVRVTERTAVHDLRLRASLADGTVAEAELARVAEADPEQPPPAPAWPGAGDEARVAICMATYNPPPELFAAQIDTIRAQSHGNWLCFISDDRSSPEALDTILGQVAGDPRFVVSRAARRVGFFNNFERALRMAPPDAQYVAIADQDDRWYPDKLQTLLQRIGGAQLAYSDARIVARDGTPLADTYWGVRRNNHSSLLSLLVANAVTGAASLLRRELLDHALPFPPAQFAHFHDHWLGLVALALGEIEFVERPLYDYVQHGDASLGHAAATRMTALRVRLSNQRPPRERVRLWRLHYFVDACRLMQMATVLELRCGELMTARKRRTLERFLRADTSLAPLLTLAARGGRELVGRPETLGAEWMLFHALLWRRLLALSARDRPQRRLRLDAVPPPTLALRPAPDRDGGAQVVRELADKVAPLDLAVSARAPARINLLLPTLDLRHFFGGYIAKLNLAKRLAARGARVRVLTVDPVGPLAPNWRRTIESYSGLERLFDEVEVEFGRGPSLIEVSEHDRFIATTWWSAHIAAAAARTLNARDFLYLIQEYEPFTFPMGSYAALASQSYEFEHLALFSSELLRDYFRRHRLGVYRSGTEDGDRNSWSFENAITHVRALTVEQLGRRTTRRLLFYARPEPHAARNMFELGALALARAHEQGLFDHRWELHGIGTVDQPRSVDLGGGATLDLLPRIDQRAYGELLADHDLGLSLMYTPHPSLVPIEMASAAMLVVTNTFENKTAAAMSSISRNIGAVEPTVEAIGAGLHDAAARLDDHASRIRDSAVAWSRDWSQTWGNELIDELIAAVGTFARTA